MGEPVIMDVYLDLDDDGGYHNCIRALCMELANHPQHEQNIAVHGEWIRHHPLLPKQEAEQPNRWMHVHLTVVRDNEAKKTTLAVRDDNVWLVGFRNQSSRWFEFGISDLRNEHLISGSTFLGCDGSYGSLLEGRNLVDINLGNLRAVDAVCDLSSYNEDGTAGTETKRNLVCLIVMISESTRMFPHYIRVTDHWLSGATLCILLVDYLHNWGKMSSAMIGRAGFCKTLRAFGVSNLQGGRRVVRLLLNKPRDRRSSSAGQSRDRRGGGGGGDDPGRSLDFRQRGEGNQKQKQKEKKSSKGEAAVGKTMLKQHDEEEPPMTSAEQGLPQHEDEEEPLPMPTEQGPELLYISGQEEDEEEGELYEDDEYDNDDDDGGGDDDDDDDQGRLLVEVFSVSASSCVVGRISVFDGRRGQIIYNNDRQGDALIDSQGNLTLTGPYKAISAGGRVAIKVTDASDNVYHTMLWDGYDDDAVYDEARTQSMTTGTDQKAEVTYAVVSNAVEATVQVQLKLNAVTTEIICFHGQITADMKDFESNGNSVLLFSRNEMEKVELLSSHDGFLVPVPLTRSVFVAPLYSSLGINVKLHVVCPPSHENMFLEENFVFSRLQQHTITKVIERPGVVVQVTITSEDIQPPQEQSNTTPPDSGGPTIEMSRVNRPGSPTAEQGTSPAQRPPGATPSSSAIIHHPDKPQSLSLALLPAAPSTSSPLQHTVWAPDSPPHKKRSASRYCTHIDHRSMSIHRGGPQIELSELIRITNNFSDAQKVGCGGYGDVYVAPYEGEYITVKLLDATKGINEQQFMKELFNHMKVIHPNVLRLVGYCNEEIKKHVEPKDGPLVFGKHIYKVLCFEYMHGRSLDKGLSENSLGDDWRTHYQIIRGTCEGLWYLHNGLEHRILHLDLKPGNILLDNRMTPKIADFGLSRIYTASRSHVNVDSVSGTTKYMAPELRNEGVVSDKADVFSFGVTVIDVISGSDGLGLYHKHGAKQFVEYVCTYWRERDNTADLYQVETCTKIAICCVHIERHQRPTMKEIMLNMNDMETQVLGKGLHALTVNSSLHIPHKLSSDSSGRGPLGVVIVYAFDCTEWTPAWYTVNNEIFWMVQEKLTHFPDSRLGYIYVMSTANTYTSDMKVVDSADTKETGYTGFAIRRATCTENMASGLAEAHKMMSNCGHQNGIILFFSDGLMNKGGFFDGTETFISKMPVHTFTLAGDTYNHVLQSIAANSPGGKFHTSPVPERANLSTPFSKLLDGLLGGNPKDIERPLSSVSGRDPLDVVIVYAFDCTHSTPAWYTVNGVFWLVQEKLTHYVDSCMGYVYVMSTPNTYTSDMKVVDSAETKETGYTGFTRRRMTCTKNMASGLVEAHKMVSSRGYGNGIIFFFSDGLINKGDFFDGTKKFVSTVPVHTFTLGGDAYNQGLQDIAKNSPGGTFTRLPVPERPHLSVPFSKLLDSLLDGTMD